MQQPRVKRKASFGQDALPVGQGCHSGHAPPTSTIPTLSPSPAAAPAHLWGRAVGWLAPPTFLPGSDGEGSLQKGPGDTGKADQERGPGNPPPSFATGCKGVLVLRAGHAKTSRCLGSLFCPARPCGSCLLCLTGQLLDCARWAEALPSALQPSPPLKPSQRRPHAGHTSRGSEDAATLPPAKHLRPRGWQGASPATLG